MFRDEQEPLTLLLELSPRLAKKRYRQSIYEAWHHKCGYCGEMATSLDHIVPRFRSGSSNRNNLVPACRSCNSNKGSQNMEDWYNQQDVFDDLKLVKLVEWSQQDLSEIMTVTTYNTYKDSMTAKSLIVYEIIIILKSTGYWINL